MGKLHRKVLRNKFLEERNYALFQARKAQNILPYLVVEEDSQDIFCDKCKNAIADSVIHLYGDETRCFPCLPEQKVL